MASKGASRAFESLLELSEVWPLEVQTPRIYEAIQIWDGTHTHTDTHTQQDIEALVQRTRA